MFKDFILNERVKFTFISSFIVAIIVHAFMLVNNLRNHDSIWHFYDKMDLSSSGRFSLKYLGGISSYFDLHYLNILLALVFLALSIVLIVEMLDLHNKIYIVLFSIIYSAFPSVASIFSYSFTADAYYLSFLLTIFAIYICNKNIWTFLLATLLLYVAIGTYQVNIKIAITLIMLIVIKELLFNDTYHWVKDFIRSIIAVVIGLFFYVVHFKLYQKTVGLTEYGGISDAGNINAASIMTGIENAFKQFLTILFNQFQFVNLYEKLNLVFVIILMVLLIALVIMKKVKIQNFFLILIVLILSPLYLFMLYFISPNVYYHSLMIQNVALIYVLPLMILDKLSFESKFFNISAFVTKGVYALIAFNLFIITNIYYEKLSFINSTTDSLMTKVSIRVEQLETEHQVNQLAVIGWPNNQLNIGSHFNTKVPSNVGVEGMLFYPLPTAIYLNYFLGHELTSIEIEDIKTSENSHLIDSMPVWPATDSVKVVDDTIIIKFE